MLLSMAKAMTTKYKDALKIDAELHEWEMHEHGNRVYFTGKIYGDRKRRFEDGELIRTRTYAHLYNNDGILQTKNSVYKLVPEVKS